MNCKIGFTGNAFEFGVKQSPDFLLFPSLVLLIPSSENWTLTRGFWNYLDWNWVGDKSVKRPEAPNICYFHPSMPAHVFFFGKEKALSDASQKTKVHNFPVDEVTFAIFNGYKHRLPSIVLIADSYLAWTGRPAFYPLVFICDYMFWIVLQVNQLQEKYNNHVQIQTPNSPKTNKGL